MICCAYMNEIYTSETLKTMLINSDPPKLNWNKLSRLSSSRISPLVCPLSTNEVLSRDNWVSDYALHSCIHISAELQSASDWLRVCGHSTMYTVCMQICSTLSANAVCVSKHPQTESWIYFVSTCSEQVHLHEAWALFPLGVDWIHLGIWTVRNFKDKCMHSAVKSNSGFTLGHVYMKFYSETCNCVWGVSHHLPQCYWELQITWI